jgi:hypothetical protein
LHEFEHCWLGMPVAEWLALDSYHALQIGFSKAHSPVAQLLFKLDELSHGGQDQNRLRLLPAWTATKANNACDGKWNAAFSARPEWLGAAAEAGAWTYYPNDPLLRDVWQKSGSAALTRVLARLLDVVELASGRAVPRLDVTSPATGEGIAVVRTARGLLMHHVRLATEQVAEYVIVAPTEWNFHPDGAFARDMFGVVEKDVESLKQLAHIAALSLDPCVAYEIELKHLGNSENSKF